MRHFLVNAAAIAALLASGTALAQDQRTQESQRQEPLQERLAQPQPDKAQDRTGDQTQQRDTNSQIRQGQQAGKPGQSDWQKQSNQDWNRIAQQVRSGISLPEAVQRAQQRVSGVALSARIVPGAGRQQGMQHRGMSGGSQQDSDTLRGSTGQNQGMSGQNQGISGQNQGMSGQNQQNTSGQNQGASGGQQQNLGGQDQAGMRDYTFEVTILAQDNRMQVVTVDGRGTVTNTREGSAMHMSSMGGMQHDSQASHDSNYANRSELDPSTRELTEGMNRRVSDTGADPDETGGLSDPRHAGGVQPDGDRANQGWDNQRQARGTQEGQSDARGGMNQSGMRDSSMRSSDGQAITQDSVRMIRFTKFDGQTVRNRAGEDVGHIEDIAVDPADGRIVYAALSFGGFLGIGSDFFAVPIGAIEVTSADRIVFDVNKERLENAQGFNKDNWPLQADTRWGDYHRGNRRQHDQGGMGESQLASDQHTGTKSSDHSARAVMKASDLTGIAVKNRQSEDLGTISDLYLDPENGRVVYAVLSHGGVLGVGNKLCAIPWQKLEVGPEHNYVLDIPKSRLENAPSRPNADDRGWEDPQWVTTVYQFYDVQPYWTTSTNTSGTRIRTDDNTSTGQRDNRRP